ncbi:MAG: TonB-dependent receptor [Marinilabiliales bacterium]|nr:MAG: TonB-dependent receptor [Marinilabiliales bacterium]
MRRLLCLVLASGMLLAYTAAQEKVYIRGRVLDSDLQPLSGAVVSDGYGILIAVSGPDGRFGFSATAGDSLYLSVSHLGYRETVEKIEIPQADTEILIVMERQPGVLPEVTIVNNFSDLRRRNEPVTTETADRVYLEMNRGGSLMTSLSAIPGISSIEIGSGHSKPLIRGLGFNRIVVVENGIRHEGQQWGADHGLEIDQYAVERIEVVKGPASVLYGSDAIGGVLRIHQDPVPAAGTLSGSIELTGRSNNNLIGGSAWLAGRSKRFFITSRFTALDYADYRIPADSVEIYSYHVMLNDRRLRNTAGKEMNLHASAGYLVPGLLARLSASAVTSRSGFFANAHGLEPRRVDTDLYDESDRDILFPSQNVSHLKLMGHTTWEKGIYRLESEAGYQKNFRQENNHYVNHGYMPAVFPGTPDGPPHLEREFEKDIFSLNVRNFFEAGNRHSVSLGLNAGYQDNSTGGYAFIIPDFTQFNTGVYLYNRINTGRHTSLHTGIRYDYGRVQTREDVDWFATPVENPGTGEYEEVFLTRAEALDREFGSLSLSAGFIYSGSNLFLKANAGKGFRMPTPKELAANGVNYHYFRYEKGDSSLDAEVSWQLDLNAGYDAGDFRAEVSPFVSYSPDYIYLDPTYRHDFLYGAGNQIFEYVQNEVLRTGGEVRLRYRPLRFLVAELTGDYIYAEQLSGNKKGFTIPFSPAPSVRLNLLYSPKGKGLLNDPYAGVELVYTLKQSRIVPPEKETPAYELLHLSAGGTFKFNNTELDINIRVQNLLNRKYFNHVSYYRLINAPESGRNFILSVKVPLSVAN